eukprot:TRINITY_DN740_c0_g1_i4.p1 TRINITY_DN740_c0_g1~~TRINITY_DN740_c0_g1_i4.p1  ORF type:complete len:138 (-),score=26.96 TRINITY_DN740_c0_g1_i4:523-936(-)
MIDKSKDGRFYLDEIKQFVDLYFERQAANANTVDVVKEFQGYCTASLWNYVANQKGKETFVKWFGKLFSMGNIAIQGKDSVNIFLTCSNTPSLIFYFIPLLFLSYQTNARMISTFVLFLFVWTQAGAIVQSLPLLSQ